MMCHASQNSGSLQVKQMTCLAATPVLCLISNVLMFNAMRRSEAAEVCAQLS